MGILKATAGLVMMVAKPSNYYAPIDRTQNLTQMPDTLILDNRGRVKVNYSNEDVRRRISKTLSDLKEFQIVGTTVHHPHQE